MNKNTKGLSESVSNKNFMKPTMARTQAMNDSQFPSIWRQKNQKDRSKQHLNAALSYGSGKPPLAGMTLKDYNFGTTSGNTGGMTRASTRGNGFGSNPNRAFSEYERP